MEVGGFGGSVVIWAYFVNASVGCFIKEVYLYLTDCLCYRI